MSSADPNAHTDTDPEAAALLQQLLRAVRDVQTAYGGQERRGELATADDARVRRLCSLWDAVLAHGLIELRPTSWSASASAHHPTATLTETAHGLLAAVVDRVQEATQQLSATAAAAAAAVVTTTTTSTTSAAVPSSSSNNSSAPVVSAMCDSLVVI